MVAAAAARAALAGLKTETYAFDKTAYPELYAPETQDMKEHNRAMCESEGSKQLRKVFDATGIPPQHQRLVFGREGEELDFAHERGTGARNEPDAEAWRLRQMLNRRDRRVWARLHYAKQKKRKSMALEEAARYVYYRDQVHRMFR